MSLRSAADSWNIPTWADDESTHAVSQSDQNTDMSTRRLSHRSDLDRATTRVVWPTTASDSSHTTSNARPASRSYSDNYRSRDSIVPNPELSPEARRQSLIALDRKRRLTGSTQDSGRRRYHPEGFEERVGTMSGNRYETPRGSGQSRQHVSRSSSNPIPDTAEIIDLTSSPPAPAATHQCPLAQSSPTNLQYNLPRWQPDSEVSHCTICIRPFTFLFRRHHCRKCGRVVCNDCSPHRITIPRQYIVQPPGVSLITSSDNAGVIDLADDGNVDDGDQEGRYVHQATNDTRYPLNSALGGGEKVRLCNPCVPDPQPEPQLNNNSVSPQLRIDVGEQETHPYRPPPPTSSSYPRPTSNHLNPRGSADTSSNFSDRIHGRSHSLHSRYLAHRQQAGLLQNSEVPFIAYRTPEERRANSRNASLPYGVPEHDARSHQRWQQTFDGSQLGHTRYHSLDNYAGQPQLYHRSHTRPMVTDPTLMPRPLTSGHRMGPRVSEDDICPICRRVLPARGADGDESMREAHIMDCISSRDPAAQSSLGTTPSSSRAPMHMLSFVATEKDCVGEDGNSQECSICMVEYDVGDRLARLECLCKFHKECISSWFERKQECPVHKIT